MNRNRRLLFEGVERLQRLLYRQQIVMTVKAMETKVNQENTKVQFILSCRDSEVNNYEQVIEALGLEVAKEYGINMHNLVVNKTERMFTKPVLSAKADHNEAVLWGKEYDEYTKGLKEYNVIRPRSLRR